jgi:uncharacterized protein (TIRG00374 family)
LAGVPKLPDVDTKQILSTFLKLAASAVMLGYLGWSAYHDPEFGLLISGPKDWLVLFWALPICLAAVTLTILRWHLLVRTLGIELPMRDALRAGFLAYLVTLLPLGVVGGDSLKAVMLIHRQPKRKTEAIATVVVDRAIGLFALLLLAAVASLFVRAEQLARLDEVDRATILTICAVVRLAAVIATAGLIVMLLPGVTKSRLWDRLEHTPAIGGILHKLVGAMRTYRKRLDVLLLAIGASICIHLLYISAVVVMTLGIGIAPEYQPPISSTSVIVPVSMIAGALPIGVYEVCITLMFRAVTPAGAPENMGLLIALGYRLIQILIASIGLVYWLTSRSEVRELIHEAEEQPPEDLPLDEPAAASSC